ncbi:isocitrate lyase/PEP mutase family protein [Arthrobacter sulfonylureivorans]|uniref:isocitrate lyase/PEP mutase family protein n=1 Tax=Arthrobacter sulfonylureivorans TaxID=2486855 RepID=UPI0039E46666
MSQATLLRALLAEPAPVRAPGAPDPLTAKLVQRAGFPAVYMTGFGATATRLGTPDLGLLTQTEMSDHARNMSRAVDIPVIADADNGYGGPSNIERTVHEYLQAGIAALHLEDQASPKRCGQLAGIKLIDADESARRIACAAQARGSADLVIIGRTDALGVDGMDAAIKRAETYLEHGADLAFVDGVKRIRDVEEISRRIQGPKVLSIVVGNETDALTAQDIHDLGFSLVFYSLNTLFASIAASKATLDSLYAGVGDSSLPAITYSEFSEIAGLSHHQELDHRFA